MSADMDEKFPIAQANARLDDKNQSCGRTCEARIGGTYTHEIRKESNNGCFAKTDFSVAAALNPVFWSMMTPTRALMGSNMQRKAVVAPSIGNPLLPPEWNWNAARIADRFWLRIIPVLYSSVTSSEILY